MMNMKDNKLETISNLFEGKEIRSVWDADKEEYYFSVVDVIGALTESKDSKDYWYRLKKRMTEEEKSELSTKCRQLKLKSKDGKFYSTDTLDTKGILRLIESVPSQNAEPFKLWLAQMGKERIDEIFDPEIAINRAIDYYRSRGYSDKWIEARLKGILRLIESVPSQNAEPFKLWLAQMEKELGKSVVSKDNALNYQYLNNDKLTEKNQISEKSTKKLREKNNTEE